MSLADMARVGARSSASLAVTLALWGCLNVDSGIHPSGDGEEVLHKWVHRWARTLLSIFGVELDASGRYLDEGVPYPAADERGVGRVFVMNHRSGMDIPIAFALADAHLVSRHDLASWPVVGRGARRLGTLFVDRGSMRSGASVLKAMTRALARGQGIFIFPEGTAFSGDEVRPFRPGAFNAARRTGAEIVPLGIAYADEAASYGDESFLAHLKRVGAMPRLRAAVVAGEPLRVEGASLVELRDAAHARVDELVAQARARLGG